MIDISCGILFGWTAKNIPFQQKVVSYAHLYSYTSVKTLVHWFQIIRAQTFQMYDDEESGSVFGDSSAFYKVAQFPTKNIHSPIGLIYGGVDSLVE
jgi:lysosomal acid lipase/cholesteryl ester hydrolase